MKIGLICPYNMARGGAVQEIVRDMRTGLTARGHTVKIITGKPKVMGDMDTTDILFAGQVMDFRSPTHTLGSFTSGADNDAVMRLIESEQFDVLHYHEPGLPILGKQILDRSTSVNVATFHAKLPETLVSRTMAKSVTPYLRTIMRDLDILTVGSEAAADYVRTLTDKTLHYVPNGVDLNVFRPVTRRRPGDRKKILYVGRLEHRKGVKYLIQAVALLGKQRHDIDLVIAGAGPDRNKLESLCRDLGVWNVQFLGFIDNDTKRHLLAEADLFCSPAIFGESFGLVLLEAMATGLVTVAGNNPGYAGVMQGKGMLSLVNPYDTGDFARRLTLLLDEEPLRQQWREWAYEYVKRYDYVHIMAQYEKLYEQGLRERGHRSHIGTAPSQKVSV